MRLSRKIDKALACITIFILSFVFAFAANYNNNDTFADNESGIFIEAAEYFVTFYDEGKKLTVKTDAATVGEALKRAGYSLNSADIVEPGLDTKINTNNFFINIYRARPAIVKDGLVEKYIMSASRDPRQIVRDAGIEIYDGDEINTVQTESFLEAGIANAYEVVRNGGRTITEQEEIAFSEVEVKDYNLAPGLREVRQLGEMGAKELVYEVFYDEGVEVKRELVSESIVREPVTRIVAVGVSEIERTPLTASRGVNIYTVHKGETIIERKETYYDLNMKGVMLIAARECGAEAYYTVREDGVKVDAEGYVLVAADLERYPRCSVVETSLGLGKVYDTGSFVNKPDGTGHEQFDIATDWTIRDGV